MPKKVRDAEIALLAEAMLRELESLRQQGGETYPPKLRQLAGMTSLAPMDEQVQKAAAKAAFTAKAVVTEKLDRKPSLDSPVYIKGDVPSPIALLAERMLVVLQAQRRLGADAYPPKLRRLAELCGVNASDTLVLKAAAHDSLTDRTVVAAKGGKKPSLDAPVVMRDDIKEGSSAVLWSLLRFALEPVMSISKGKTNETTAFTPSEVEKRLVPDLQKPVGEALSRGIERQDLPEEISWVLTKGKPYFFLADSIRPHPLRLSHRSNGRTPVAHPDDKSSDLRPRPTHDFAGAFREAFEQLDRRNGSTNFVKLSDLRLALAGFGRDEFDAGLRSLRVDEEFSLDSHEGLHGSLTHEDREAGVREAGSLLIYACRR